MMILPSLLLDFVPRMARMSPSLRASNEGLLRPRVARAQGTHRAIPPLLASFFNILLEIHPELDIGPVLTHGFTTQILGNVTACPQVAIGPLEG